MAAVLERQRQYFSASALLQRQCQYFSHSVLPRQFPIKYFFRNSSILLNV
jgi:hypothetical protein